MRTHYRNIQLSEPLAIFVTLFFFIHILTAPFNFLRDDAVEFGPLIRTLVVAAFIALILPALIKPRKHVAEGSDPLQLKFNKTETD